MVGVLFVLFVVVPIVELFVFVQVASAIGFLPAVALVLLVSFAGLWLVKREGISVTRRVQEQLRSGVEPTTELLNGLLIFVAGLLMVFPGFVTAFAGLLLLVPPTRAVVRALLMKRMKARLDAGLASPAGSMFRTGFGGVRTTRVFTGTATYGGAGVVDVREVRRDGPTDPGTTTNDPPELGRR